MFEYIIRDRYENALGIVKAPNKGEALKSARALWGMRAWKAERVNG